MNRSNACSSLEEVRSAIREAIRLQALSEKAVIQRCQWHKRENILKYLKKHKSNFRRKLQLAYDQSTYEAAKKKLNLIKRELAILNQSAVCSLEEGM